MQRHPTPLQCQAAGAPKTVRAAVGAQQDRCPELGSECEVLVDLNAPAIGHVLLVVDK